MSALTRQSVQCDEDDRFSDRCASNSGHKHGLQVKNSLKCSRKKELGDERHCYFNICLLL